VATSSLRSSWPWTWQWTKPETNVHTLIAEHGPIVVSIHTFMNRGHWFTPSLATPIGVSLSPQKTTLARRAQLDLNNYQLTAPPDGNRQATNRLPMLVHAPSLTARRRWGKQPRTDGRAPAVTGLRDGLLMQHRVNVMNFGNRVWNGRSGQLVLAPPRRSASLAIVSDHLIFVWQTQATRYAITLHAWEPLTVAVNTLKGIVNSLPSEKT
jgi:hypothetical protein